MNKEKIAKILLENKAVTLNAKEPYTYSSGIRSPIYCDNRALIASVDAREKIVQSYLDALKDLDFNVVAGISTAGIPWAAWISSKLNKPMAYIRGGKKGHGKGNQIEGAKLKGKKTIIIEDLISTGGSSFAAVQAARDGGAEVIGVIAIFTYELEKASKILENTKVIALTNFSTLIEVAKSNNDIDEDELKIVKEWNKNPQEWGPNNGFPNAN